MPLHASDRAQCLVQRVGRVEGKPPHLLDERAQLVEGGRSPSLADVDGLKPWIASNGGLCCKLRTFEFSPSSTELEVAKSEAGSNPWGKEAYSKRPAVTA